MTTLKIGNRMRRHGFTLLETIIVLAVMTMFFAISIPLFSKFTEKAKLDTTARSIASVLRTARSYAISNNTEYYAVFDDNTMPHEYFISADGTDPIEKRYKLPTGIDFDSIDFTDKKARFTSTGMLGGTAPEASVIITDGTDTKTITVERTTGRVRIED